MIDPYAGVLPLVLVVDDHPLNLELMEGYLSEIDCRVATAGDGMEALQLLRRETPDLVLLDVMMPGLDGFEVCRRIKASPEGRLLPVVLVTALGQSTDRVNGLEAGADDFIVKPVERLELVARVRSLLRVKVLYDRLDDAQHTIFALARVIEAKDSLTESHTERVGHHSRRLGKAAGLQGSILEDLYWGGTIHDIGKIGVPDAILCKPSALTAEETAVMQRHVLIGEEIARPLRSVHELLPIIRHHHEFIDGGGYPDGLRGSDIPLPARIVAICDAFDAMIADRPYRRGRTEEEATAILRAGAGRQWDGDLVTLYLKSVVGTQVGEVKAASG